MTVTQEKSYCNDDLILKIFFNYKKNKLLNPMWKSILIKCSSNIKNYLENRYDDSSSIKETLYRIKFNIELRPVCKICGNPVQLSNLPKSKYKNIFKECCCDDCARILSYKNRTKTCIKKFGVENPFGNKKIIEKIRNTQIKNHGGYTLQTKDGREKIKNTSLKKYGVENPSNSYLANKHREETYKDKYGGHPFSNKKIIQKIKNTWINKYGVIHPWKSSSICREKMKETLKNKYGVTCIFNRKDIIEKCKSKEVIDKRNNTKRKHHTFNTSLPEEKIYKQLCNLYNKEDIIRQYKCERYPWCCDFYIKSKDLFIEYQGFFTHQDHAFNSNNKIDINILNNWKRKNTKFYNNAIQTWIISDVNKRNTAKKNHLNYLEFFNMNEFNNWYENEYLYRMKNTFF